MIQSSDKLTRIVQSYFVAKDETARLLVCQQIMSLPKLEAIAVCLEITFRDMGWGLLRAKKKMEQGFPPCLYDDLLERLGSIQETTKTGDQP